MRGEVLDRSEIGPAHGTAPTHFALHDPQHRFLCGRGDPAGVGHDDAVGHHRTVRAHSTVDAVLIGGGLWAQGHVQCEEFKLFIQRPKGVLESMSTSPGHFDQAQSRSTPLTGPLRLEATQKELLQLGAVQSFQALQHVLQGSDLLLAHRVDREHMLGVLITTQQEHAAPFLRVVRHVASAVPDDVLVGFHHHERQAVQLVAARCVSAQEGLAQGDQPGGMIIGESTAVQEAGPIARQRIIECMGGGDIHAVAASAKYRSGLVRHLSKCRRADAVASALPVGGGERAGYPTCLLRRRS